MKDNFKPGKTCNIAFVLIFEHQILIKIFLQQLEMKVKNETK